jgi:hypothetical protein
MKSEYSVRGSASRRSPNRKRNGNASSSPSPGLMMGGDVWRAFDIPGFTQENADQLIHLGHLWTPEAMFDYSRSEFYKKFQSDPNGPYYFWLFVLVCINAREVTPKAKSYFARAYADAVQYMASTGTWRYGYNLNGQLI